MHAKREKAAENYLYKNDGKASHRLLNALDNYRQQQTHKIINTDLIEN